MEKRSEKLVRYHVLPWAAEGYACGEPTAVFFGKKNLLLGKSNQEKILYVPAWKVCAFMEKEEYCFRIVYNMAKKKKCATDGKIIIENFVSEGMGI